MAEKDDLPASGGVDAVAEVVAEELALKIVSLSVNWLREDGTDREHEDYVRANWTKEIAEAKRLILASLSPAATPVSEAGGNVKGWAAVYDGQIKSCHRSRETCVADAEHYQAIHPVYLGPAWRHQED